MRYLVAVLLVCASWSLGQDVAGFMTGKGVGYVPNLIIAQETYTPEDTVSGRPGVEFGQWRSSLMIVAPIEKYAAERGKSAKVTPGDFDLSFAGRGEWLRTNTTATLPMSGKAFPTDLYDVRLGVLYRKVLSSGQTVGVNFAASSASDEPFHSMKETNLSLSGFARIPTGTEGDAAILFVDLSTNRDFWNGIPLPGIAFQRTRPTYEFMLGLPFINGKWTPDPHVSFSSSYFIMRNISASVDLWLVYPGEKSATRRFTIPVGCYFEYAWENDRYRLSDRTDDANELQYYQQRVEFGVRSYVTRNIGGKIFAAWNYDRFWYQGASYDDRDMDRMDIEDGLSFGARFEARF